MTSENINMVLIASYWAFWCFMIAKSSSVIFSDIKKSTEKAEKKKKMRVIKGGKK